MIRPRARWKLLTVGIFGAALLIITGLISLGMTLIVFGWGDLSEPYIEAGRNGIRIILPILYTIRNALTDCVSMLFIACLTFLISVLFKKGIFAIAVSVLVYAFGGLAAKISLDLIYDLPFLKYTVIPYNMALNGARYDAIARVQSWFNPVITDYGLSLESGVVIMLVTSFVLIALSFVIFNRQQIKN